MVSEEDTTNRDGVLADVLPPDVRHVTRPAAVDALSLVLPDDDIRDGRPGLENEYGLGFARLRLPLARPA